MCRFKQAKNEKGWVGLGNQLGTQHLCCPDFQKGIEEMVTHTQAAVV